MDTANLNTISMCTGIGGLELGVRQVLSTRTVCYVEREAFAIAVLAHQMRKGALDVAPIWTDLTAFDGEPWRGKVDLITAGFPCQPHSAAGKRKGTQDERWIWEDISRIIHEVGPRLVFLENVPGLLSSGFARVLGTLAELGFDAEWVCVKASDVGAPHKRNRLFILAHTCHDRSPQHLEKDKTTRFSGREGIKDGLAYGDRCRQRGQWISGVLNGKWKTFGYNSNRRSQNVPDSEFIRHQPGRIGWTSGEGTTLTPEHGNQWPARPGGAQHSWEAPRTQPQLGRSSNGPSVRVDRLRAIGNAVVPAQAAFALRVLLARITEETNHAKT